MTWTESKSLERIRRFQANIPETDIRVEDFASEYLTRRTALAKAEGLGRVSAAAIVNIPRNRAILTDGVHVYADLMDFGDQLMSERDSAASFRRALQFLHLHYGGCDRLIETFGLQRVDFHGSRLHAVVLTPTGEEFELERLAKALAFARAFEALIARASARFSGRFRTRVAVGIDLGKAVAINSGRGGEQEPLFIGRPANHAAHLAACGQPGIHLSDRAKQVLLRLRVPPSVSPVNLLDELARRGEAAAAGGAYASRTLAEARDLEIAAFDRELAETERAGTLAVFNFHHHQPPLKSLDFAALPPSNAVLMDLIAVFADLDGFTGYVDRGMASGLVRQVVANLHVIRGELAATVRDDFGGRKVRYIGDCLQAILAEGDARSTRPQDSVEQAVLAAGGLRSSFDLCRRELPGIADLGLAIGLEYGATPACRIGLRGDASVRCVTSGVTCESERLQQDCDGAETALGEEALRVGGVRVQRAFRAGPVLRNLTYRTAETLLHGLPAVHTSPIAAPPVRAHGV